jgi:hypothetical protein
MYHLAFFVDYRPFLLTKLRAFLHEDFTQVGLYQHGREQTVLSLADLPAENREFYQTFWFLHGPHRQTTPSTAPPEFPLYRGTSLTQIQTLFQWFADHYTWVLCPWGGMVSYMSLAFVTAHRDRYEQFVHGSDNTCFATWNPLVTNPEADLRNRHNMLISSYVDVRRIEESCHAIVFEDAEEEGARRVWEVCRCAATMPSVVYWSWSATPKRLDAHRWDNAHLTLRGAVGPFAIEEARGAKFAVFQPQDHASFMEMCHPGSDPPDTLIVFPDTTPLTHIEQVIAKAESDFAFADLCYLSDFLASGEWVYAIARGHIDDLYGLFVARDSALVRQVSGVPELPGFKLIACF